MSYILKIKKIHHYPTRNCDKYHIQTSTDSFSNVSARIWKVITTNIDVNISSMQFKIVLKLYLHENEVILKYTKCIILLNYDINILLYYDIHCY